MKAIHTVYWGSTKSLKTSLNSAVSVKSNVVEFIVKPTIDRDFAQV